MGRKIVYICVAYLSQAYIYAFTAEIATSRYKLDTFKFFPTTNEQRWRGISLKGIDNLGEWVSTLVPLLTILMAIGATAMLVLGGFYMVMGGADSEQTEKGKSAIRDAIIGLIVGLLAYVIIVTLGNFFNF